MEIVDKVNELKQIDPSISEIIDSNQTELPQIVKQQKAGKYFFRAIRLSNLLDLQNWNERTFEARPEFEINDYGRLNLPHESMMYFCNQPQQTLKEIGYDYQTPVVIAAYQVKTAFKSLTMCADYPEKQITGLDNETLSQLTARLTELRHLFSQPESSKLNRSTTKLRHLYNLNAVKAQAWTFPVVDGDALEKKGKAPYNLAMYPGLVKQYLQFVGAIVISDANPEGKAHTEFCFDDQYRLDYLKGYPELEEIFGIKN